MSKSQLGSPDLSGLCVHRPPWKSRAPSLEILQSFRASGIHQNLKTSLLRKDFWQPVQRTLWKQRHGNGEQAALMDESRKPHRSPLKTCVRLESFANSERAPYWGGRKIHRVL
jgi:hypothetical protein